MVEAKGPEAGERYKKAKYGEDDEDDGPPEEESAGGGKKKKKTPGALADLAMSANDVPPNFNLLVVFALGLLRALLRKMSGEASVPLPGSLPKKKNVIVFPIFLGDRTAANGDGRESETG